MAILREIGFNRVSMGVQDFDPQVQLAVNRIQSEACTLAVIDAALIYPYKLVNDPYAQGVINAMVSNTPSGRTGRP